MSSDPWKLAAIEMANALKDHLEHAEDYGPPVTCAGCLMALMSYYEACGVRDALDLVGVA